MADYSSLSAKQLKLSQDIEAHVRRFDAWKPADKANRPNVVELLSNIGTLFDQFEDHHVELSVLLADDDALQSRSYFKNRCYETTKALYETACRRMEDWRDAPSQPQSMNVELAMIAQKQAIEDSIMNKLAALLDKNFADQMDKIVAAKLEQELNNGASNVNNVENENARNTGAISKIQNPLLLINNNLETPQHSRPSDHRHCNSKNASNLNLSDFQQGQSTMVKEFTDAFKHLRLGHKFELEFPEFPNDVSTYPEWRRMVYNYFDREADGLPDALKIQKLKEACKKHAEAKQMTDALLLDQTSFVECMETLDARFGVIRNAVFRQHERLIKLESAGRGQQVAHIKKVHDEYKVFQTNMRSYATELVSTRGRFGEDKEAAIILQEREFLQVALIHRQLDDTTRAQMAQKFDWSAGSFPKVDQMLKFMHQKFISGLASHDELSHKPQQPQQQQKQARTNNVQAKPASKCLICDMSNHKTAQCRQLTKLPTSQRFALVKEKKLCANCLNAKYRECDCAAKKTTNCRQCDKPHHDVLHESYQLFKNTKPRSSKTTAQNVTKATEPKQATSAGGDSQPGERSTNMVFVSHATHRRNEKITIMPTAVVSGMNQTTTNTHQLRCLLDTGASDALITYEAANKLGLKLHTVDVAMNDFQGEASKKIKHEVVFNVTPRSDVGLRYFELEVQAYVVQRLNVLPWREVEDDFGGTLGAEYVMADPNPGIPGSIDIILGASQIQAIRTRRSIARGSLLFEETFFGWTAMGIGQAISTLTREYRDPSDRDTDLLSDLNRFFEYEGKEDEDEDAFAERHFVNTTVRDEKGYTVRIPWKKDHDLGKSKALTIARIKHMMRRLTPEEREAYKKHCQSLKDQGYMTPAVDFPLDAENYIANFALFTDSITTPLRLLFTCDQRTSNMRSVNDVQVAGRKLQKDLPDCLIKFRQFSVAVTADVSKMFLRVRMHWKDALYQHTFIPGDNPDGELEEVQLSTVIFGMKSSPFLAMRTLLMLADDEEVRYPEGAALARSSFYIDDFLYSFPSTAIADQSICQLDKLMKAGNFELMKWASNNHACLRGIRTDKRLDGMVKDMSEVTTAEVRVLGLIWEREHDVLQYRVVMMQPPDHWTLRLMLGIIAKIFDPIGLLAPTMALGKMLIQEAWTQTRENERGNNVPKGKSFDRPVNNDLDIRFNAWTQALVHLRKLKVDRCIGDSPEAHRTLIGYADASLKAFGCCVYLRTENGPGNVYVKLVMAKGSVTPKRFTVLKEQQTISELEALSMPRLELTAAKQLADVLIKVKRALELSETDTTVLAFTDSQVVLTWIRKQSKKWEVFVENRVMAIRRQTKIDSWHYVDTKENPADLVSRGVPAEELLDCKLWFQGPLALHEREILFDQRDVELRKSIDNSENEKLTEMTVTISSFDKYLPDFLQDLEKISSYDKTLRVVRNHLWLLKRLLDPITGKEKLSGVPRSWAFRFEYVTQSEEVTIATAEKFIIRKHQEYSYRDEMNRCVKNQAVVTGPLRRLAVFIDEDGLLRVGGRMGNQIVSYEERHPIILPKMILPKNKNEDFWKTCPLTKKIIRWAHERCMHGGVERTWCLIRQKFHIPNGRNAVKFMIYRCMRCSILRKKEYQQLMGNLPTIALRPAPPFWHTTVDYAGPISVFNACKSRRRSKREKVEDGNTAYVIKDKGWIAVFVCRVTGAYHLELVSDLLAESCVMAFKRFVAARGVPKTMRSDNASTFKRTANILDEYWRGAKIIGVKAVLEAETYVKSLPEFADMDFTTTAQLWDEKKNPGRDQFWHYNPPYSPEFGGRHESAVKQVKLTLKKAIGQTKLSFVNLYTALKQIEAALNSRPLCRITGPSFEREQILTPSHLMIGRPLVAWPEHCDTVIKNSATQYAKARDISQYFWKVWNKRYLEQLQPLAKWRAKEDNLKLGEIVLLKEDHTPPLTWTKAKVKEVFEGADGLVRVAILSTPDQKEYKRSIRNIIRLPVVVEGEEPEKAESEPEEDDHPSPTPPKRSARLAQKRAATSALSRFVLFMSLVAVAFSSSVKPVEHHGLLYFQDREVLVRVGHHHVEVETGLKPNEDIAKIQKYCATFENVCMKGSDRYEDVRCGPKLSELEHKSEKVSRRIKELAAVRSIEEENLKQTKSVRRKRSTGVLVTIFQWLFGSNESDGVDGTSMGKIQHAVRVIDDTAKQIRSKEIHIEREVNRLHSDVDKQFGIARDNKINIQVMLIKDLMLENMGQVLAAYENLVILPDFEPDEFESVVSRVNKEIDSDVRVPDIPMQSLKALITLERYQKGAQLYVNMAIPVTFRERFHKFYVMPIPQKNGHEIPDVEPKFIVINQRLMLSMESEEVTTIDDHLEITNDPFNIMSKINEESPCEIRVIAVGRGDCPMKTLPATYDVWHQTPVHNLMGFYSNVKRELICKAGRTTISEGAGLMVLDKECYVETSQKVVRPSRDGTTVVKHSYKFHVNEDYQLLPVVPKPTADTAILRTTEEPIDVGGLDDVLMELTQVSPENFWEKLLLWSVVAGIGMLCGVLGLGLWLYVRSHPRRQLDENIELTAVGRPRLQAVQVEETIRPPLAAPRGDPEYVPVFPPAQL